MAISDLFSTSFLFSIAIIIILIGGIFTYVNYKIAEQDHKLTSMVNLVSILAQDLRFIKSKLVLLEDTNINNIQYSSELMGGQQTTDLISVSDGGDDDDDEDNEDEDNEDEDDDSSYVSDDEDNFEDTQEHIKLLNLTLANEDVENNSPIEDLIEDFEQTNIPHLTDEIKTIHLETPIQFEETEIPMPEQTDVKISNEDIGFLTNGNFSLKNVTINDLGEQDDQNASKSEYKKMSLNKLREVAVSKGVIADASKLKKNELLKMLGEE